jgi:N-acyl-L-homoserine lactone synthetase
MSNAPALIASETEDALAARADAAAVHMVNRLTPVSFRLAATPAEREAAYRLRYQAVIERGWRPAADMPGGLEREPIDDQAHHLLAWLDGRPIATCRLIVPVPGVPLPLETAFEIELHPAGQVVQVDRICIDRAHAGRRSDLLLGLLCAIWQQARARGYCTVAGIHSAPMLRLFHLIGLEPTPLGQARRYWGEERYPVLFQAAHITDRFFTLIYSR